MKNNHQVLLYYKYVPIADPVTLMNEQRAFCLEHNLKGRIIIANEGINGTVEGLLSDTEAYVSMMTQDERFTDIDWKRSEGTGSAFPKLSVKVRPEIVTSGVAGLDPRTHTGKYLTAEELHQWFVDGKEFYVVDMRNDYEYISGFFDKTIFSDFKNFKDLPSILPKLSHLKSKTIVTVCTGGVRCEKASGFLVTNGFHDVYQLLNGIQTYMEKYPNEHFKGKLYVFDNRLTVGFNTNDEKHVIVGSCTRCGKPSDNYVNCADPACHKHCICCTDCLDKETGLYFCNDHCKEVYSHISLTA
jgi:UPF0176 protein